LSAALLAMTFSQAQLATLAHKKSLFKWLSGHSNFTHPKHQSTIAAIRMKKQLLQVVVERVACAPPCIF
jgi:hypothetical protein